MTIPYMFWDYDDDKQSKVIEVLRRREEVTRKQYMAEQNESDEVETVPAEAVVQTEEVMS